MFEETDLVLNHTQPEISQACRKLLILPACGKLSTSRDRSVGFVRR
jgi:hypothetical protein